MLVYIALLITLDLLVIAGCSFCIVDWKEYRETRNIKKFMEANIETFLAGIGLVALIQLLICLV